MKDCIVSAPESRPTISDLRQELRVWLAEAGQKSEAKKLFQDAKEMFGAGAESRDDRGLRKIQRDLITAITLDSSIENGFLEEAYRARFKLALAREDLSLASALWQEHLESDSKLKQDLVDAQQRREARRNMARLLKKVTQLAGWVLLIVPFILVLVFWLSDAYQKYKATSLAENLLIQARGASDWSRAQALISRASGLDPNNPHVIAVQSYWAELGVTGALEEKNIKLAEERLRLVRQSLEDYESIASLNVLNDLETVILQSQRRIDVDSASQWTSRLEEMKEDLSQANPLNDKDYAFHIARKWAQWDWINTAAFTQFTDYLCEILQSSGFESDVAMMAIVSIHDRSKGGIVLWRSRSASRRCIFDFI